MRRLVLLFLAAALAVPAAASAQRRTALPSDSVMTLFSVDSAAFEPALDALDRVSRLSCGERQDLPDGHCVGRLETGDGSVCRGAAILTAYRAVVRQREDLTWLKLLCTGRSVAAGLHQGSGERAYFRVEVFDKDDALESFVMLPLARIVRLPDPPARQEERKPEPRPRPRRSRT